MKYLRYFENVEGREIDLQQLWNDFTKYKKRLSFCNNYEAELNFQHFLDKILSNNYVEFNRVKNRFDDEITYSFEGEVRSVFISKFIKTFKVYVSLYNTGKYPMKRNRNNSYLLADIMYYSTKPIIIKVYSDVTKEEEELELLKNTEKYNL